MNGPALSDRKWWWPEPTDEKWCERMRAEYPEFAAWDDDSVRDHFSDAGKYADVWDHLGDAREDWELLADDWLRLKRLAGEDVPEPT